MLDRLGTSTAPAEQAPAIRVLSGREFDDHLRNTTAAGRALIAADLVAGRVLVERPTTRQARQLTGASRSYAHTASRLSPMERAAIRSGALSLATVHPRPHPITNKRLEKLIGKIGLARVWDAIDRLTR